LGFGFLSVSGSPVDSPAGMAIHQQACQFTSRHVNIPAGMLIHQQAC
jgi:hypothetical protein